MSIAEHLASAFGQATVAFGIGSLIYGIFWFFFRRSLGGQSLFKYLGLAFERNQFDRTFWAIWIGSTAFAVLSVMLELRLSEAFRQLLLSESSPYGKILKTGIDSTAILKALIYCFLQASLAEELLFRGLIAKRLFNTFGLARGNVLQALIFWLMHWALFQMVTGEWFSFLQLVAFATSFGLGLVFGFVNSRKSGVGTA